jgi:hypothetical protein
MTFHEDDAQLGMGYAPEMLSVLNTIAPGLFAKQRETDIAHARRDFPLILIRRLLAWGLKGVSTLQQPCGTKMFLLTRPGAISWQRAGNFWT